MREGDRARVGVIRSTIAALDNATAVAAVEGGVAIADSAVGAGTTDVARKELSASDMTDVLEAEALEREQAAALYVREGQAEYSESLLREAALIRSFIT